MLALAALIERGDQHRVGRIDHQAAMVSAAPMPTLRTLLHQRIRWGAKSAHYPPTPVKPAVWRGGGGRAWTRLALLVLNPMAGLSLGASKAWWTRRTRRGWDGLMASFFGPDAAAIDLLTLAWAHPLFIATTSSDALRKSPVEGPASPNLPALTVRAFFRHEPTALLGAVWILLWTAVALTSTLWRPDPTPNANDQHLEWSLLPPGAEVNLDADGVAENTLATRTFGLGTDRFGRDYLSRLVADRVPRCRSVWSPCCCPCSSGCRWGPCRTSRWPVRRRGQLAASGGLEHSDLAPGPGHHTGVWQGVRTGLSGHRLSMWVEVARVVRGQTLALRHIEWVEAGRVLGLSTLRIVLGHILPNLAGPIAVLASATLPPPSSSRRD